MAIIMICDLSAAPLAMNFVVGVALHIAVPNGHVDIVASSLLVEGIEINNRKDCAGSITVDHTELGRCKAAS